jgi:hypothetical protein
MPSAHEFLAVGRAIALRQDQPIKWFEIFAAVKVDKSGSHKPSPARETPAPLAEVSNAAAWLRRATGQPEAITAVFPGTYPSKATIPKRGYR